MNINNLIDKFLAVYLFASSLISLVFLLFLFIRNSIEVAFLVPISASLILILSLMFFNVKILFNYNKTKTRAFINLIAGFLQLPFFYSDGFQYKYNQGVQLVIYGKIFDNTSDFKFGFDFQYFSYLINFQFLEFSYTSIGIDLMALFIFIYYIKQYVSIKSV